MTQWAYSGYQNGTKLDGVLEADSKENAQNALKLQEIQVVSINPKSAGILSQSIMLRPSAMHLANFTRRWAMMSKGVPTKALLEALKAQESNAMLQVALAKIQAEVTRGTGVSLSFAQHPKIFDQRYISILEAVEISGDPGDTMYGDLADMLEDEAELAAEIKSAMTYPATIMIFTLGVAYWLVTNLVPQFAGILAQLKTELPPQTKFLIWLSHFLSDYWYIALSLPVVLYFGIQYLYQNQYSVRRYMDGLSLKIPVIGKIIHLNILSRTGRTLGLMMNAAVPTFDALEISKGVANNILFREALQEMQDTITDGRAISQAMRKYPKLFVPTFMAMVEAGEELGNLNEMLTIISHQYQKETKREATKLTKQIEPFLIIFMGITVGFIVMAVMFPMFSIIGSLSKGA